MSATSIPEILQPELLKARERLQSVDDWGRIEARDKRVTEQLDRALVCSEYFAGVVARYPQAFAELLDSGRMHRPLEADELEAQFLQTGAGNETEAQFMRRLRVFRHREMMRIIVRDLAGWSDTREMLRDLSALADTCLRAAFLRAAADMQQRYGVPRDAAGREVTFVIVAMGKLGGGELNFSSDVDVVFIYTGSGETDGPKALANEEYFRRLAQSLINLLSKKTADGFVYRVDARLRPFGDSGPLACSIGAFEDYLTQHGRDWERYAWVKARAINAWEGTRDFYISVLRPFVYRRYLDFGVFSSLREMKLLIEQEGRAEENRNNVKLGPGGIREIEFIVQTLQLVRGGTLRNLRERRLLVALEELGNEELMPAETVAELSAAYCFLRDIENRIQMIADRQTHELPRSELNRARLCLAMNAHDWEALCAQLNRHRDAVQKDFDHILRHERDASDDAGDGEQSDAQSPADTALLESIAEQCFADPQSAMQRIEALRRSGLYQRMDEIAQQRLNRLLPAMLQACSAAGARALDALDRMLRIIEAIGRRSAYIALLNENQAALDRLVNLCASSDFLARQIQAHPLLLDELLDQRVFLDAPTRPLLEEEARQRFAEASPDDPEQRREALRNFHQAAVFRIAVADLSGTLPLMRVSDRLTNVAEIVLQEALDLALAELTASHGDPCCSVDGRKRKAGFAIAGYGKLGGWELGYGSDLDIVFLHDSAGENQETDGNKPLDNAVFFARVARRITDILTMHTATGPLYEVDTRLRPSGNSGLLVTSLQALETYQRDDAWTWEHQALLRARAVAGAEKVRDGFQALRTRVLIDYVRRDTLAAEVIRMRTRMRDELSQDTAELFDIKQGMGGMIDIEFLVQYLVLKHAPQHRALLLWSDNIRQLESLGDAGILTGQDAAELAEIYRAYRTRVHLLSLAGDARTVPRDDFAEQAKMVSRLWQQVFPSG